MNRILGFALFLAGAAASAGYAACGSPAAKLAAEKSGDLGNLLGDRRRPDAELVSACGAGALTPTGQAALRRTPYLQQVAAQTATVVFTSASDSDLIIDVTQPDGTLLSSVLAERDDTAQPNGAWQGFFRLEQLAPSTLYCYSLRGLTDRIGFRTAPAPESVDPVRFIAFGDSGTGSSGQYAVKEQMLTVPFDLVLHTGDVAYDTGTLSQIERTFFGVYGGLTQSFPVVPVSGNHDYATEGAKPFRDVFMLPENGGPNGHERWFSFDWGQIHFVGLDTERMNSEQAAWLADDLARSQKPWKIAYAHRPAFSSGQHGSSAAFRTYFHPILAKHGVALVLNGHEHNYERIKPQDGVTYIVTGGGGRGTRSVGSSGFTAFSEDVLHFVQVEVFERELIVHAIDGTGREFDSVLIRRPG
jgi:acid phosphatase type 7